MRACAIVVALATACVGEVPVQPGDEAPMDGADAGHESGGEAFSVAVLSDLNGSYGSTTYDSLVHSAAARVARSKPDLVLSTGDMVAGQQSGLNYPAMWQGFHAAVSDVLAQAGLPFAATPGNHDASAYSGFEAERTEYEAQWLARRPDLDFVDDADYPFRYAFAFKGALFISLDATTVGPLGGAQMSWLEKFLAANAGDFDPIVVFGHIPLYPFTEGRETEVIGDGALEDLLNRHGVDLFVSGHHHAYYPGKKGGLRLVGTPCVGGGPRKLIGGGETAPRAIVWLEVEDGEVTVVEGYQGTELDNVIVRATLPASIGVITRDDL
jgi:3',5'-cyclic AMP phosphodiesterase CpdA